MKKYSEVWFKMASAIKNSNKKFFFYQNKLANYLRIIGHHFCASYIVVDNYLSLTIKYTRFNLILTLYSFLLRVLTMTAGCSGRPATLG